MHGEGQKLNIINDPSRCYVVKKTQISFDQEYPRNVAMQHDEFVLFSSLYISIFIQWHIVCL